MHSGFPDLCDLSSKNDSTKIKDDHNCISPSLRNHLRQPYPYHSLRASSVPASSVPTTPMTTAAHTSTFLTCHNTKLKNKPNSTAWLVRSTSKISVDHILYQLDPLPPHRLWLLRLVARSELYCWTLLPLRANWPSPIMQILRPPYRSAM